MRGINKEILRLAVPSILANITIPLVGLVDTAIVGHLSDASAIGGIASNQIRRVPRAAGLPSRPYNVHIPCEVYSISGIQL